MFEQFSAGRSIGDDGVGIRYVVGGAGPPLLLLHGFPQNLALWARVAPVLAQHFTVVCSDLRGYGDSDKPPESPDLANYGFRAMARDQVALMRRLGFERFAVAGHDRGGRVAYRLALDHPERVSALAVLDIVPTDVMLAATDRRIAHGYWHWFFLSQPAPFPEHFIAADPDRFFETCLVGWGAARLEDFDPAQLDAYRRCWRDPDTIRGACSDYRAAIEVDLQDDLADAGRTVDCPALVLYGEQGTVASWFDVPATWAPRLPRMQAAALPGGHFFVDVHPQETAAALRDFFVRAAG